MIGEIFKSVTCAQFKMKTMPPRSKDARIQRRKRELQEVKELQEKVESYVRCMKSLLIQGRKERSPTVHRIAPFPTNTRWYTLFLFRSNIRTEEGAFHYIDRHTAKGTPISIEGKGHSWGGKNWKWENFGIYNSCPGDAVA